MRKRFTKWYAKKGYGIGYIDGTVDLPDIFFLCPWWVGVLCCFLFSPSVYFAEAYKGGTDGNN